MQLLVEYRLTTKSIIFEGVCLSREIIILIYKYFKCTKIGLDLKIRMEYATFVLIVLL